MLYFFNDSVPRGFPPPVICFWRTRAAAQGWLSSPHPAPTRVFGPGPGLDKQLAERIQINPFLERWCSEEWGQASRGTAWGMAQRLGPATNCVEPYENQSRAGARVRPQGFPRPSWAPGPASPVNEACAPPAGLRGHCTSALEMDPATGSGNQMSRKGGVSTLPGPLERLHPRLTTDQEALCGAGNLHRAEIQGSEFKTGLCQRLLPKEGGSPS